MVNQMKRVLFLSAALLVACPLLALAQGTFTTIVSPTIFPTTLTGTVTTSATGAQNVTIPGTVTTSGIGQQNVDCIVGCAGSASTSAFYPVTQAFSQSAGTWQTSTFVSNVNPNLNPTDATSQVAGSPVTAENLYYNGTTWDRTRGNSIYGAEVQITSATCCVITTGTPLAPSTQVLSTQPPTILHPVSAGIVSSFIAKASAGALYGYNCTAITGGAAGFCVAYNSATAPVANGPLTAAAVLDFCYFDTTARGCSLSHVGLSPTYSNGMVIIITTATSPYTTITSVATGAISVDNQ